MEESDDNPRHSARVTKGKAPDRYGDVVPSDARKTRAKVTKKSVGANPDVESVTHYADTDSGSEPQVSKTPVPSKKGSRSSQASARRLQLEAQLAAAEALNKLDEAEDLLLKKKIERDRKIIKLNYALEQSKIEEKDILSSDEDSHDSIPCDKMSEQEKVTSWLEQAPDPVNDQQTTNDYDVPPAGTPMSGTAELAQAILSAINNASTTKTKNDDMRKFVARQSIAKELPFFSGDPEEWPSFISQFKGSTESCGFTNQENITRLSKSLKGKAKETVQALLVSSENVEEVLKTLEMNFGRPEMIIKNLVTKARAIPGIKDDKPEMVLTLSNAVRNLVTTMETVKKTGHMSNPQLMEDLIEKLPNHLKLEWVRLAVKKDDVTLNDLSVWLTEIASATALLRSVAVTPTAKEKVGQEKKIPGKRNDNRNERKEVTFASTEDGDVKSESKKKSCIFCGKGGHEILKCYSFAKLDIDSRWKWVTQNKTCFSCLKGGHQLLQCKEKTSCEIDDCRRAHHKLLHKKIEKEDEKEKVSEVALVNSNFPPRKLTTVLLRVLPVTLYGPAGEFKTYAMFDECSSTTLVDPSVAEKLGATGPKETLTLTWLNSTTSSEKSNQITLWISGDDGNSKYKMENVRTRRDLDLPLHSVNVKLLSEKYRYLTKIKNIESMQNVKPTILIGQDNIRLTIAREVIEGPNKNSPTLSKSKLGWVVHGSFNPFKGRVDKAVSFHCREISESDDLLHELVKESFKTEAFGVKPLMEKPRSNDEIRAQKIMDDTLKRIGDSNQFEVGLLWKDDNVCLPESKSNALKRLYSIERKMDKDPEFAKIYTAKMEDFIEKGYARKLTLEEIQTSSPKTWYLPHFAAYHPKKPGVPRLVFDAASRSHGVCLNDKLLKGPDLLNSLPSVLFKFRQKAIGFGGDIKEMFPQVKIRNEDLPSQRFLWRGADRKRVPDIMVMTSMIFGATCSPCLAAAVKNVNARQYENQYPEAVKAIVGRHYVDDYLDSSHTEEEALQLIKEVMLIQEKAGYQLMKWTCSSPNVLQHLPENIRAHSDKDLNLETELPYERMLGVHWNPNLDCFTFVVKFHKVHQDILEGNRRPTKRDILKLVMSVFDPVGFLGHFLIKAKIILQEIWRSGTGWDDEISEKIFEKWISWLKELKGIANVKIPRCYSMGIVNAKKIDMHVFCDASEMAFAAVAYLRIDLGDVIYVSFVAARTRVAPLRPISIPRLELQAALMGSRLANFVEEEHEYNLDETHYWSDSKTVLCWLRSDARQYKQFVAHRVGEIAELTKIENWHWIPTLENVADEATRNSKPSDFTPTGRWFSGPDFLKLPPTDWPKERKHSAEEGEDDSNMEMAPKFTGVATVMSRALLDISKFSSWSSLIRTTGWLVRFINNFALKMKRFQSGCVSNELQCEELAQAERYWLRLSQKESFSVEMDSVKKGKPVPSTSRLANFTLLFDDFGLLRLRGRTSKTPNGNEGLKQPVILAPKHPFTRLLIDKYHVNAGHQGQEMVLNELRQRYWILEMRTAVRSAWNRCQTCKIRRATPEVPMMGELPECRLRRPDRPFSVVGVDYFGPMEVTIGRRHEKRYGVLFTCLSTRAVHLEIAASLTTDSAIMAIRRMIGRRGHPVRLYSDNGTNFRGADSELKKSLGEMDQEKLISEMSTRGISWHFIPPSSPHMGGSWERLVQSVKKALRATLKERAPREEVLQTLFVEAENVVNSRPLTHVSVDPDDPESLTPNSFLIGRTSASLPPGVFSDSDLCLRKLWRISQKLADNFWNRWITEYLPTLTRRTKWHPQTRNIKVGDVVIIADSNATRNSWPRGIVTDIYPGKDGVIRVVDVKTVSGVFRRPVAKLCILDVDPKSGKEQEGSLRGEECPRRAGHSESVLLQPPIPRNGEKKNVSSNQKDESVGEKSEGFGNGKKDKRVKQTGVEE